MQEDLFRRLRMLRLMDSRGKIHLGSTVEPQVRRFAAVAQHYETVLAGLPQAKKIVQPASASRRLAERGQIYPRNIAETALLAAHMAYC
jgi:hypothetical protein